MKKILFGAIFLSFMAVSCSKDGDDEAPVAENFLNTAPGSTWNYETTDNANPGPAEEYTLTSTNRDSSVNSRSYHIYTNSSTGASEYNGKFGNDYYMFQKLPDELGGADVEELYLKSAASVNGSWSQTNNISVSGISFTLTNINKIIEKGVTRVVNGITYTNVTHVKTDIVIGGLPPGTATLTTDIHQYYAPNYGMIESKTKLDITVMGTTQSTDVITKLKTATLL